MISKVFCCGLVFFVLLSSACFETAEQAENVSTSATPTNASRNTKSDGQQINSNVPKETPPINQAGNTNKAASPKKTDDATAAFDQLDERKVPRPIVIKSVKPETVKDALLEEFLRKYLAGAADDKEKIKYSYNRVDLNDDGRREMIVYVESNSLCGTGGCPTLIVADKNAAYHLITEISLTKGDLLVSEQKTNSWRDLISFVSGGGYILGHYVLLKFNGTTYPENPTVEPAIVLPKKIKAVRYLAGDVNFRLNVK